MSLAGVTHHRLGKTVGGLVSVLSMFLVGLTALSTCAAAQNYPTKPIRIIANSSAGALTDMFARIYAQKLQERSGQPVIVDNRPAATGTVGADYVAKSDADGYTLLVTGHPAIVTLPLLNPKSPYAGNDFAPIVLFGSTPSMLLVKSELPAKSAQGLIAMAKAKPATVTYGSQGLASSGHMATAQFTLATNTDLIHVPFRGSAPALTAILGGQVDILFETVRSDSVGLVREGKVRALAVAAQSRVPALPDVPTMSEAGVSGVESGFWVALFAPKNTPPEVVQYLNRQAIAIFSAPDVREMVNRQTVMLSLGSPEDLRNIMASEIARWGNVIRRTDIKFPG
jgi:tripartite-type tricarboxylate transporter receptor subunit TctC